MNIKVKKLREDAVIPTQGREGDAGYDLIAVETTYILPKHTAIVPTGISIELPEGYEGQVRPRSGISLKGLDGNYPRVILGTVDSNYRGAIGIITNNPGDRVIEIKKGTKLAQLVINKLPEVFLVEVVELNKSNRGTNGFGSSGLL